MADCISELIFSFAFADAAGRERAAAELVQLGAPAVPRLVAALEHPDDAVRGHAALTLGYMKAPEAGEPLARLVSHPETSDRVRGLAMRALAEVASPALAQVLYEVAARRRSNRDLFVRALACTVLGKLGDPRGKPLLEASLRDPEPWVREAAHKALAELRAQVPAQPTPTTAPVPAAAVLASAVVRTGADGSEPRSTAFDPVAAAIARLRAPDQSLRDQALAELIQLGPRALPGLSRAIYDAQTAVACAATQALGRIGDRRALGSLSDLLASPATSDTLRAVALHAVAALLESPAPEGSAPPPAELTAALLEHARSQDRFVRAAALSALGRLGGPAARGAIAALLDDGDAWVREAAAGAAARGFGPDDGVVLPRLIEALSTALEPRIQARLLRAMSRVASRGTLTDRTAVGPATHFLTSPNPTVRVEALEVLGRFLPAGSLTGGAPDPRLVEDVVRCLADPDPTVRRLALSLCAERLPVGYAPAMGALLSHVDRSAPEVTRLVALALARIGDQPAIDALLELARDPDTLTAQSARQALGRIPREAPVQVRPDDSGQFVKQLAYRCQCGGTLGWVETPEGREELRCPACGTDHVVTPTGQLMTLADAPNGTCLCAGCRRRSVLAPGTGEDAPFLVCPRTGQRHVRPFDRPLDVRRLDQLPLGACRCCPEAQPLEREASPSGGEQVVCHRSRRAHVLVDGAWLPAGGSASADVAAINRALIAGSMALTTSGLPIDEESSPPGGHAGPGAGASPPGAGLGPGRGFGPR